MLSSSWNENRSKSEWEMLEGRSQKIEVLRRFSYVDSSLFVLDAMHVVRHSDDLRRVLAPVR